MNVPETMNEVLDMSDDEVRKANAPEMLSDGEYISDVEEERVYKGRDQMPILRCTLSFAVKATFELELIMKTQPEQNCFQN
eukprot:bmy_06769T0